MAIKTRGVSQAMRRTDQIFNTVKAQKVVRALKSASYIIRTESATMTPVATSTLINSQFDTIISNGVRITAKIGYSAAYALYVHNAPGSLLGTHTPRTGKLKGKGNVWDKTGEPEFLKKAVNKTRSLVDSAIKREMKL